MTLRIGCWLAAVAAALAVALAAPARADVDTDFANQLHGHGNHPNDERNRQYHE
jgi:hypothetical protein